MPASARPRRGRHDEQASTSARPARDRAVGLPEGGVPELASRLRMAVARLNRQLRQQSDVELPPTRLAHLSTIEREGPLTLGELAAAERVAPATVTKVVTQLEGLGLVARETDAADRRVVRVRATPEGVKRLHATRTRKTAWLAQQLDRLDRDDLDRLAVAIGVLEELAEPKPH